MSYRVYLISKLGAQPIQAPIWHEPQQEHGTGYIGTNRNRITYAEHHRQPTKFQYSWRCLGLTTVSPFERTGPMLAGPKQMGQPHQPEPWPWWAHPLTLDSRCLLWMYCYLPTWFDRIVQSFASLWNEISLTFFRNF